MIEAVKSIKYSYYKAKDLDFKPVAYDINNSKKVRPILSNFQQKKTVLIIALKVTRKDSFGHFYEPVNYLCFCDLHQDRPLKTSNSNS